MLLDDALVGRDDLLDELRQAAENASRGSGAAVLLTGEAGIGKTSVARALTRRVRDDLAVSWGTCSADRAAPPFWPWRALIAPDFTPVESAQPDQDAIGVRRFERLRELRDQLIERARHGPLIHLIEDLQWADVASVLLLVDLAAEIVDVPILVVATLRTGDPLSRPLGEAIEEVSRVATVRQLPPLLDHEIAALMRQVGLGPDEALTTLVRSRTGGNPLYVGELLRSVQTDDPSEAARRLAQAVPSRVAELVSSRLARLPTAVADLVVSASVVGAEGDVRTIAAVQQLSVDSTFDLVEQAQAARVLDSASPGRWRFRHELVRDAVYRSATDGERARRHAAVLDVLSSDSAIPPPVLAHHALAAVPLFDADRAVALAARAGELAFAHHAYEEAVGWFERALAAAPPDTTPRWRAELLVLSGEACRQMGATDDACQAFVTAAELTDDPALIARAALGYADPGADLGIAYRTEDPLTIALLERAIAAHQTADSLVAVMLEARLAAVLYFSDEPGRARVVAQAALERARRLDDPRALGASTAMIHDAFVVGQVDLKDQLRESAELLDWARASGSVSALLTAHRARVFDLLAAGDLSAMDTEIVAFTRQAEPLRAPSYLWWPSLWSAMRALLEGQHDRAEERALATFEVGEHTFPLLAFMNLSFLLFFLRREQGRLLEMEQATRDAAASSADIPALRVGLILLLAELGRTDEAAGLLASVDSASLARLHDRNWPASWFQLARAVHLVGDRRLAAELIGAPHRPSEVCVMVSLATTCLGASDLAEAWLLHTLGELDRADERYASAAEINARIGARSWLAQTRVDHARLLVERGGAGDHDAARLLVELAEAAADEIGLAPVTAVLADLRERLAAGGTSAAAATFRRSGAVWEVTFSGHTARLADSRGLRDVAYLLAHPEEAISVLELVDEAGANPDASRGAPTLDERARREIRARLHELDAAEADAEANGDGEAAALAREQRQELAEAVARDFGLGGRTRRLGDPVEKARKTVSTRIRRAVTAVAKAHPDLGRHLERSIDTGRFCAYRPAEPIHWLT